MKKLLIVISSVCMVSSAFAAGTTSHGTSTPTHSGTGAVAGQDTIDGCGLGWQVTQKRTLSATTTRGTTNAIIPPAFGMTTGTIGCEQLSISKNEMPAATYVVNNFEALNIAMAQGQGEVLQGFARTLGCTDASFSQFGQMTQSHYESLSQSKSGIELFQNVRTEIQKDPVLAASCNAV